MNKDIRLSTGFWSHPKTRKLVKRLGLEGVRSLQILWLWAAQERPDGNLAGLDWEDIELAADWQGEERAFFEYCLGTWIDETENGYVLHDWAEHNPWQAEAQERSERARQNAIAGWEKRKSNAAAKQPHNSGNAVADASDMPEQCDSNAAAKQPHNSGNAPSPSPSPSPEIQDINTPPPPPQEGGEPSLVSDSPDKPDKPGKPDVPEKPRRKREPTGNSIPELREQVAAYTANPQLRQSLEAFRVMRERIRKPLTGRGMELSLAELDKLAGGDTAIAVAIVDQSVQNSWQGLFPLKGSAGPRGWLDTNTCTALPDPPGW